MLADDGDIARGLGFVSMYSAWVEEEIDDLLRPMSPVEPFDEKKATLANQPKAGMHNQGWPAQKPPCCLDSLRGSGNPCRNDGLVRQPVREKQVRSDMA